MSMPWLAMCHPRSWTALDVLAMERCRDSGGWRDCWGLEAVLTELGLASCCIVRAHRTQLTLLKSGIEESRVHHKLVIRAGVQWHTIEPGLGTGVAGGWRDLGWRLEGLGLEAVRMAHY